MNLKVEIHPDICRLGFHQKSRKNCCLELVLKFHGFFLDIPNGVWPRSEKFFSEFSYENLPGFMNSDLFLLKFFSRKLCSFSQSFIHRLSRHYFQSPSRDFSRSSPWYLPKKSQSVSLRVVLRYCRDFFPTDSLGILLPLCFSVILSCVSLGIFPGDLPGFFPPECLRAF